MEHYNHLNMKLFQFNNATESYKPLSDWQRWLDAMEESVQDMSVLGKAIVGKTVVALVALIIAAAANARHNAKGVNNSVVHLIRCISTHRIH